MKEFLEKHEAVIEGWLKPVAQNPKHGEIVPHQKQVSKVYFYQRHFNDGQDVYIKIELTRQMILDLSDKIQDVESHIVEMPFDEIPF